MESRLSALYHVAIVTRPDNWRPASWGEVPDECEVLWIEERRIPRRTAEGIVFGFNSASIDANGSTWAVPIKIMVPEMVPEKC